MALSKSYVSNFETLKRAFASGDVALMECVDAKSGEMRAIVCAVEQTIVDGQTEFNFIPFAALAHDDPYTLWNPPA